MLPDCSEINFYAMYTETYTGVDVNVSHACYVTKSAKIIKKKYVQLGVSIK